MILRSGKYKGRNLEEIKFLDPQYIRWIKENRPEMLRGIKKVQQPKPKEEFTEEQTSYKNLPRLSWKEAFGIDLASQ
jgi:hypothetical protein